MSDRVLNLHYKRHPLRVTLEADGAWLPSEDVGLAIGMKEPKAAVSKLPEHEKSLRQIGGQGVRMRVLSVEGVQRLAGATRVAGAVPFLDWFRAQAMPQIALAMSDVASETTNDGTLSLPLLGTGATDIDAVVTADISLDVGRSFLYDKLPVRLQVDSEGEILFRADDVCQALELGNPWQAIATHVEEDDLQKLEAIDSLGRTQQANYVNLSGLYALVFGSKKEAARRFKRWVTHEVLPSIQKTGGYRLMKGPVGVGAGQTHLQKLALSANASGLAATMPGQEGAMTAQLRARHDLVEINRVSHALREMHIDITFPHGFEQPVAVSRIPEPIDVADAGKVLSGRVYLLEFSGRSVEHPRLRPLLPGEYLVKAEMLGVKFLANQSRFGLEEWSDLEEWARRKVQAEKNRE